MKAIDQELLDASVQRIVAALDPEVVYLYGSHAYGQPHEDSDVDLLVVIGDSTLPPHRSGHRAVTALAYRALRGLFFPAEIKVVTRAEFQRRAQWRSSIERIALEKGRRLYESAA